MRDILPHYMEALRQCEVRIVRMNQGEWGEIFYADAVIHISKDIDLLQQCRALLHECLHWRWPSKSEAEIERLESKKWNVLKAYELRALLESLYPSQNA